MDGLGERIHICRRRHKISLKHLAEECDVSSSFISQIEKGKAFPSLSTLSKIASVLHTSIGDLADGVRDLEGKSSPVLRYADRICLDNTDYEPSMQILSHPADFKIMEPMLFTFRSKGLDTHFRYRHYGQEFALVLKGTIEVILDEASYRLTEGDSIYFDSSRPHLFFNPEHEEAEVLSINTPPNF